jgi:hypothetical protein
MRKVLLFGALAASLLVPAGAVALAVAAATSGPVTSSPDEIRPATEFDKDQLVAIRNELAELDRRATPGSTAQILEARRIAREARTWAVHFESEPEWEELALATSALAAIIGDGLEKPTAFRAAAYDRALARLQAADQALPDDWHS